MSNRAFNLSIIISFLACATVAGWAIRREGVNAGARRQRQAAVDAARAATSAAVRRADDFMVATHYRENMNGAVKLNMDVQPLLAEMIRLDAVIGATPRTPHPADVAARRKARADLEAQDVRVKAGIKRVQDYMATHPVDANRLGQMTAETNRFLVAEAAAAAVVVKPASRAGTWATLLTAAPPLAWIARRRWVGSRTRHRREAHRCVACDYDLRASPGRCPECGAEPAGRIAAGEAGA